MIKDLTVVGDPHAKLSNLDKIETLQEIVEDLGNDVLWLGDRLDTKEVFRSKCLNQWFTYFFGSKLHHYILVGNHDYHNLECKDHSLRTLMALDNVTIIDEPTETKYGLMVPYIHDHSEFEAIMRKAAMNTAFIHQGFTGFDYGNGFIAKDESNVKCLDWFESVISGHFHKYQKKGNLTYLGTPFSHSFGESNQTKYIGVFNTQTKKLELLETPFPKHLTVELNCEKVSSVKSDPENYLRYVLNGSQEVIDKFDRTNHPAGTKFIEKPTMQSLQLVVDELESNEVKFKKWAEAQNMEEETIDMGLELLSNVPFYEYTMILDWTHGGCTFGITFQPIAYPKGPVVEIHLGDKCLNIWFTIFERENV